MGGQYFRESPRAADISLTEQPDRAVSNTHSVFVRAALPGMVRVAEKHAHEGSPWFRVSGDVVLAGHAASRAVA